jgi:hypothetical protein
MDWFKSVQKQAQEAAEKLMQTEAAAKALAMAQQAGQQAKVFAEQAKVSTAAVCFPHKPSCKRRSLQAWRLSTKMDLYLHCTC